MPTLEKFVHVARHEPNGAGAFLCIERGNRFVKAREPSALRSLEIDLALDDICRKTRSIGGRGIDSETMDTAPEIRAVVFPGRNFVLTRCDRLPQ